MSTSTQWLGNLFADVCVNAKIVNTRVSFSFHSSVHSFDLKEQVLYETFEEMFDQKNSQNEIFDAQGLRPQ